MDGERSRPMLSPALSALFPPGVVAAELIGEADSSLLLPDELFHIRNAVPKRVSRFAAGRLCARLALEQLNIHGFSLCPAADRRPLWPAGIVGSITHTDELCAAVVAPSSVIRGLGIDIENVGGISADIAPTICTPEELAYADCYAGAERDEVLTLIFSAKEAFYKCQYPETGQWLDFQQVAVEISPSTDRSGAVATQVLDRALAARLHPYGLVRGRYLLSASTATAAVCVSR
jgi:4'-phosphopantetheinyl transferase EntD